MIENEKMFELAVRNKFRFPFKGSISTEDLWDLSVEDLDSIFKNLNLQIKKSNEESLLGSKTKEDEILDLKIKIIKYIVSVKLAEKEAKIKAKENKEKKQKILAILAAKQEKDLESKSIEELTEMLNELN